MELNHAQLLGFRTKYETIFNQAFNLAKPQVEKISFRVDSGRVELVNHRWLRGLPTMREFKGARVVNNVSNDGLIVRNKLWENTIGIPRVDIERDQWKLYDPLVARSGEASALHRDAISFGLLSDMLSNTAILAYDGVSFYGNHNVNRAPTATFNNKTTGALNQTNLGTGITALKNRRDSAGNLLAAAGKKLQLVVHPTNSLTAHALANLSFIVSTQPGTGASTGTSQASQSENILKGMFEVVEAPYLATTTEWHLMLVDAYYKPIIWQVEQDIEFLSFDKFLFEWSNYDEFRFGVRALYNVAPGLPEMTYGSTGTV